MTHSALSAVSVDQQFMNCMTMKHFSAVLLTVLPAVLHAAQQTHFQDVRRGGRSEFAVHHPARRVEAAGSDHGALQCLPSECWCVSFGNCASEDGSCFPDECYDQELCPGGGYSCAGIAGSGSGSGSGMGTGSAGSGSGSGSGSGGGTDAMGCLPSQCWCVSFGNCHSEDGSCFPDECYDEELCPGGGYMCAGIAGSGSGSGSGGGSGGFAAETAAADTAHGGSKKEAGTMIGLAAVVAVAVVAAVAMIGIMAWKMRTDHRVTVPVDIELEQQ